jgi:hypothetical protein
MSKSYKTLDLVADVKRRLGWLEHVTRLDHTRIVRAFVIVTRKAQEKLKGPD